MSLQLFQKTMDSLAKLNIDDKSDPQFFIFYKDKKNGEHCITCDKFVLHKKLITDSLHKILNDVKITKINIDQPTCEYFAKYQLIRGYQKSKRISLNNPETIELQFFDLFNKVQQVACKEIAKAWIKTIEPNKQTSYPYKSGNSARPPWWPEAIKHKEPDHIRKEERINLLSTICRTELRKFNTVGDNKDDSNINEGCTAMKLMSCEKLVSEILDDEKRQMLREIYYLSYQEHLYKTGKLESPSVTVTDLFSSSGKKNYKINAMSINSSKSASKEKKKINPDNTVVANTHSILSKRTGKFRSYKSLSFLPVAGSNVANDSVENKDANFSLKRKSSQMENIISSLLDDTPSNLKKQKISISPISFDYNLKTPVFSNDSFASTVFSDTDITVTSPFDSIVKKEEESNIINVSDFDLDVVLPSSTTCKSRSKVSQAENKILDSRDRGKKNSPFIATPLKNKPAKPKMKLSAIKTNFDDMKTTMAAAVKSSILMSSASAIKAASFFGIPLTASWKKFSPKSFELVSNTILDAPKLFTPRIFESINANFEQVEMDFNYLWPEFISGQDK